MNSPSPDSPENRLLDELLREQTRGTDEAFLQQIENAVDAAPAIVVKLPARRRYGRLAMAAGVGLAAGITFFFHLQSKDAEKAVVARNEAAAQKDRAVLEAQQLSKAIRDQEDKVEERRKVLATIVRTKGVIYKGQDSFYAESGNQNDALKSGLDAQDFGDAKRDLAIDEQRLRQMKGSVEMPASEVQFPDGEVLLPPLAANSAGGETGGRAAGLGTGRGKGAGYGATRNSMPTVSDAAMRLQQYPIDGNSGDRYGSFIEQPWKSPDREPLSTFSIDVDTASYGNVRRMIREGRAVPKDAVRIEEFINAFSYDYAQPKGEGPFAVGATIAACPWAPGHQLVRVAIKGREIDTNKRPASNLVFLVDVSGSMQSPDRLPLLKRSMELLVEQLDERDRVAIVVYAGKEGVALPSTRLDEEGRAAVLRALSRLDAGGSTNGGAGIKLAYELAMKQKIEGGVNRVILATDGDFNVGVTGQESLVELVKDRAKGGVFLTVAGFGTGNLNDAMMDAITRDGNGNYFYIDSEREGRKVFMKNLTGTLVTIAKDVKIQVEFNPAKVGSYRLIGYANRVLRNEDFNNDKVDAGDIGAGHTVTAFYELTPPDTAAGNNLKYQSTTETPAASAEWLTVKLRHKHPEGDESSKIEFALTGDAPDIEKADSDFQFATAAALFGMKLRGMEEVQNTPWEKVLGLANASLADDTREDRAEFVEMVKKLGKTSQSEFVDSQNVRTFHHKDGSRSVFVRSSDAKTLVKTMFSKAGVLVTKATYGIDAQGRTVGGKIFDGMDHELFKVRYGYQKNSGRLVEVQMFDSREKTISPESGIEVPVQKIFYSYDQQGNRLEPVISNAQQAKYVEELFGINVTKLDENPFSEQAVPAPAEIAPENRR